MRNIYQECFEFSSIHLCSDRISITTDVQFERSPSEFKVKVFAWPSVWFNIGKIFESHSYRKFDIISGCFESIYEVHVSCRSCFKRMRWIFEFHGITAFQDKCAIARNTFQQSVKCKFSAYCANVRTIFFGFLPDTIFDSASGGLCIFIVSQSLFSRLVKSLRILTSSEALMSPISRAFSKVFLRRVIWPR